MESSLFDEIIADVAAGVATYKALAARRSNFKAFYGELAANDVAREKYARAKADGLDILADEIIALADECRIGEKYKETKEGNYVERGDMVERSRLQIDSRKWLLSKLAPKKYGERLDLNANVTGGLALNVNTKPKDVAE